MWASNELLPSGSNQASMYIYISDTKYFKWYIGNMEIGYKGHLVKF